MKPRRSPYEIIWEILPYCTQPRKVTHVLLACNLSAKRGRKYLDMLTEKGLLEKRSESYVTTEKGMEYIKLFNELYRRLFSE